MTPIDPNTVVQNETGLIRLYEINLLASELLAFKDANQTDDDETRWPLKDALGARFLDSDFIEVFDVADLAELGLAGYLTTGNGVSIDAIEPYRERLDAVTGTVLMVASSAFGGFEQTLSPKPPLRHIATFQEEGAPVTFKSLPNPDPQGVMTGTPAKKAPSDAAMGGRVATVALLVMAFLVWLMIKVAG